MSKLFKSCIRHIGRIIIEHVVSMPADKREKVLNCHKPTKLKELKQFNGLSEFFQFNHTKYFSKIMKPLHETLEGYNKSISNKKLIDEAEVALKTIQIAISECATLYFMDDKAAITLHIDVSDYGMCAYSYRSQSVDGMAGETASLH